MIYIYHILLLSNNWNSWACYAWYIHIGYILLVHIYINTNWLACCCHDIYLRALRVGGLIWFPSDICTSSITAVQVGRAKYLQYRYYVDGPYVRVLLQLFRSVVLSIYNTDTTWMVHMYEFYYSCSGRSC